MGKKKNRYKKKSADEPIVGKVIPYKVVLSATQKLKIAPSNQVVSKKPLSTTPALKPKSHVFHKAIELELQAQKRVRRSLWVSIDNIELLEETPGHYVYSLDIDQPVRVNPDSLIKIKVPRYEEVFEVQVLLVIDQTIVVFSEVPLPQQMALVKFQFDPTFILKKLDEHLDQVLRQPPPPLMNLLDKKIPATDSSNDVVIRGRIKSIGYELNDAQLESVVRMQTDTVHLLWGPPGTGKTYTLGISIAEHIKAGKSCLLLSTSNVAVDELVRATASALKVSAANLIFRAGFSKDLMPYTAIGHFERQNPLAAAQARQAQEQLDLISLNLKTYSKKSDSSDSIYNQIQKCKDDIKAFRQEIKSFGDSLLHESRCVASTLANLVINPVLGEREFDVVYIDEASMVSLTFAFAGAAQATKQVIFAGDFRQLPPICHSTEGEATKWFGRNIFDFLNVPQITRSNNPPPYVAMLRKQYRMPGNVASIVSELSYSGKLESSEERNADTQPIFIDVSEFCGTSYFSVQHQSFYQPFTAYILHSLKDNFSDWLGPNNLILSPFRAQQMLLQAVSKDISTPACSFTSITVHKAQGSQEHTVIFDLTTHSPINPHKFFTGDGTENLMNVALSRTQHRLILIGNLNLLRKLSASDSYWRQFLEITQKKFKYLNANELFDEPPAFQNFIEGVKAADGILTDPHLPSIFVQGDGTPYTSEIQELFSKQNSLLKLIVVPKVTPSLLKGGITYRTDEKKGIPSFAVTQGVLYLPLQDSQQMGRWIILNLPETTKKLAILACGHLIDSEFDVNDMRKFLCPKCQHPLILQSQHGIYRLHCERNFPCFYSRPMSQSDARSLIETYNILCPDCGAKTQPRIGSGQNYFLGCSNYPHCQGKGNLSLYAIPKY